RERAPPPPPFRRGWRKGAPAASSGCLRGGHEKPLEQIRVVEMPPTYERRGVMAPLAHGAGGRHPHRPEHPPFRALRAGHDAVGSEKAAPRAVRACERTQLVVVGEAVDFALLRSRRVHALDVVRPRRETDHEALAGTGYGSLLRHERRLERAAIDLGM